MLTTLASTTPVNSLSLTSDVLAVVQLVILLIMLPVIGYLAKEVIKLGQNFSTLNNKVENLQEDVKEIKAGMDRGSS